MRRLPRDVVAIILDCLDPATIVRCWHTCKMLQIDQARYLACKRVLFLQQYEKRKSMVCLRPDSLNLENNFLSRLYSRIKRGRVSVSDFWYAKGMLLATVRLVNDRKAWDSPLFQKDVYSARSLVQGCRIGLHLLGIDVPEPPDYHELPLGERTRAPGEQMMAHPKLVAYSRKLRRRYIEKGVKLPALYYAFVWDSVAA